MECSGSIGHNVCHKFSQLSFDWTSHHQDYERQKGPRCVGVLEEKRAELICTIRNPGWEEILWFGSPIRGNAEIEQGLLYRSRRLIVSKYGWVNCYALVWGLSRRENSVESSAVCNTVSLLPLTKPVRHWGEMELAGPMAYSRGKSQIRIWADLHLPEKVLLLS